MDADTESKTTRRTPAAEPAKAEEPRYASEYLVANARSLLSSRGPLVAGALSGTNRKTHTIKQAKEALEEYLDAKRPEEGREAEAEEE